MLIDYLVTWGKWNWLILAAIFFVLELLAPGAFMMWLGLSALLVGVISFLVDWPWQYQFISFAGFALASLPLWRRFSHRVERPGGQPVLHPRPRAVVGPVFPLGKPISS